MYKNIFQANKVQSNANYFNWPAFKTLLKYSHRTAVKMISIVNAAHFINNCGFNVDCKY